MRDRQRWLGHRRGHRGTEQTGLGSQPIDAQPDQFPERARRPVGRQRHRAVAGRLPTRHHQQHVEQALQLLGGLADRAQTRHHRRWQVDAREQHLGTGGDSRERRAQLVARRRSERALLAQRDRHLSAVVVERIGERGHLDVHRGVAERGIARPHGDPPLQTVHAAQQPVDHAEREPRGQQREHRRDGEHRPQQVESALLVLGRIVGKQEDLRAAARHADLVVDAVGGADLAHHDRLGPLFHEIGQWLEVRRQHIPGHRRILRSDVEPQEAGVRVSEPRVPGMDLHAALELILDHPLDQPALVAVPDHVQQQRLGERRDRRGDDDADDQAPSKRGAQAA